VLRVLEYPFLKRLQITQARRNFDLRQSAA
jgi:hypothetical protein